MRSSVLALIAVSLACAETPDDARAIMARVGANQERAEKMRAAFIYDQNVLVRLHRVSGRLAREEISDFTVLPSADGVQKKRLSFRGLYERDGRFVEYGNPRHKYKGTDIDGELTSELVNELTDQVLRT